MTTGPGAAARRRALFVRLVWGALWRRRERLSIALAAITIGLSVASALLLVTRDVERMVGRELKRYGPNVVVVPRSQTSRAGLRDVPVGTVSTHATFAASSPMAREAPDGVRASAVVPLLYGTARAVPEPMRWETVVVAGTDFDALERVHESWDWQIARTPPRTDIPLWLGSDAAKTLGAQLGESLPLQPLVDGGQHLAGTVARIFTSGGSEDALVYLPMAAAERLLAAPGERSVLLVRAEGDGSAIERAIASGWLAAPDREARALRRMTGAERELLGRLRALLTAVTLVALATAGLCTMSTLTDLVLERRREVALLKALGAARRDVLALFLGEATLLGVAGGVAGFGLGVVMAQVVGWTVFQSAIRIDWTPLPAVLGVALALTFASSLAPLRVAIGVAPAPALRGE